MSVINSTAYEYGSYDNDGILDSPFHRLVAYRQEVNNPVKTRGGMQSKPSLRSPWPHCDEITEITTSNLKVRCGELQPKLKREFAAKPN